MDNLLRDSRLALRRLARERGFAAVAILTLAVGIGANTAIFSIVDGVLLRPLGYPEPDQLVSLHVSIPQFAQQYPEIPVDALLFAAWRQRSRQIRAMALVNPATADMTGAGEPQQVMTAQISASMFQVLGVGPRLGRAFLPEEDQPSRNHVVVLTDAFWRSQFHADPHILGRTIELNGAADQIVGVMPASFRFPKGEEFGPLIADNEPGPIQLFRPIGLDFAKAQLGSFNYGVFARLRRGASAGAVRAELEGISTSATVAAHTPMTIHVVVTPLRDQIVGNHRAGLWLLLAAVGAILLIVCLNLANLLLVRVHGRAHETAIRLALGASRPRLLRETLTEGMVLALAGGGLGVLGAVAGVRWLVATAPSAIPRLDEVGVNATALGFALLVALASGALFSLWPALRAAGADPQGALRSGGRGAIGARGAGRSVAAREWLVGAQCALTAALLIVAGLLTASYMRLMGVDKGFETSHVLSVEAEWVAGTRAQRAAFYQAALLKLQALPGAAAVGLIDQLPTQGTGDTDLLSMVGDTRPMLQRPLASQSSVSADYFAAMDIPMLRGRTFTDSEMAAALLPNRKQVAAVISAATAAKIWPGRDPIGQIFTRSDPEPQFTVVGVVGDVRSASLQTAPGLMFYTPFTYQVPFGVGFEIRTAGTIPASLGSTARATIWSAQPAAAIPQIKPLGDVVTSSTASRRFQMSLVLVFAATALFLAALGIYGVVAYSVARRTDEIGIRLTLGAGAADLFGMVLRQGLTPVVAGLIVGVIGAVASGRLLASLLFGVHATDPAIVAAVSLVLLGAGALACSLPARRATRIDPLAALRQ